MRQRVMIAMALASDPEPLIADEPTTALDVTTQAGVIDLLHRLADERQMAVMLITHDLGVVASFAEDVLVMYAGARSSTATSTTSSSGRATCTPRPSSRPSPKLGDKRAETLPSIPGVLPRADAIPPGCRFAPRCRLAGTRATCRTERPGFEIADPALRVACHFTASSRGDGRRHPSPGDLARRAVDRLDAPRRGRPGQGLPRPRRSGWAQALAPRCRGRVLRHQERGVARSRRRVGSGKSTVARLLLGLTRTRGEVTFEGRPLEAGKHGLGKKQRGVQMVFQDPGTRSTP